jgi:ATP-dependent DNA helicase
VRLDYVLNAERIKDIQQEFQQELQQELQKATLYSEVLRCIVSNALSRQDISLALGQKKVSGQLNKVIQKLIANNLIERTIPEKPNHPAQKFRLTERGQLFLGLLAK